MSSKKNKQGLSTIVTKALQKTLCPSHKKPLTLTDLETLTLHCQSCPMPSPTPIEQIILNPIEAVLNHNLNKDRNKGKIDIQALLKCIEEHQEVRRGFEALVGEIRATVNVFCDELLMEFQMRWQRAFEDSQAAVSDIRDAQNRYHNVFEELLEGQFKDGTAEEFQAILRQFCCESSEDPSEYLRRRIDSLIDCTRDMPIVDWQALKELYQKITDPESWEIGNFLKPSFAARSSETSAPKSSTNLLIPDLLNPLKKRNHYLKLTPESLTLYFQSPSPSSSTPSLVPIHSLPSQNDSYYELPECQLVGVSYQGLTLYSYSTGQLEIKNSYAISGCESLLAFPGCLVVEAQGRIVRVWVRDGKREVVGLSGTGLRMAAGGDRYQFQFVNGKGVTVTRSAFHNQP